MRRDKENVRFLYYQVMKIYLGFGINMDFFGSEMLDLHGHLSKHSFPSPYSTSLFSTFCEETVLLC